MTDDITDHVNQLNNFHVDFLLIAEANQIITTFIEKVLTLLSHDQHTKFMSIISIYESTYHSIVNHTNSTQFDLSFDLFNRLQFMSLDLSNLTLTEKYKSHEQMNQLTHDLIRLLRHLLKIIDINILCKSLLNEYKHMYSIVTHNPTHPIREILKNGIDWDV